MNSFNSSNPMPRISRQRRTLDMVGFRLPPAEAAELNRRADALGVSPHLLARSYVTAALQSGESKEAAREQMEAIHNEILAAREDLAVSAEALLQLGGKATAQEAALWAKENMNLSTESPEQNR